jgi:hypothetical protein
MNSTLEKAGWIERSPGRWQHLGSDYETEVVPEKTALWILADFRAYQKQKGRTA